MNRKQNTSQKKHRKSTPNKNKSQKKRRNRNKKHLNQNKNNDQKLYEGIIKTNRKATGYIDFDNKDNLFFPMENLNTALNGDLVKYKITNKKDKRSGLRIAIVESVLERARARLVGRLQKEGGNWFIIPDDDKFYIKLIIINQKQFEGGLKQDMKVLAGYSWSKNSKYPEAEVLEIIGMAGEHNAEIESIVKDRGFDIEFPIEVQKEAKKIEETEKTITKEDYSERKDFRDTLTFTIDPETAKDFDDALSIKSLDNDEFEIGIHIADVSYYVRPDTHLDKEAQKRLFSVYLVDRTIPMLPEELSNDLCSLNPNEEKRAFSAVFKINKNAEVQSRWFGRTIIKSNKRFTYKEAEQSIKNPQGLYHDELNVLNNIAKKFRKEKNSKGAIDFETEEVEFVLDKNGKPLKVVKKERLDTHKLIEEYMLLANKEVAKFISDKHSKKNEKHNFLYRTHDIPDIDRISDLSLFLKALGHTLKTNEGVVTNKNLQKLMNDIEGSPQESLIKTAILRSMSKATYATKNIGHFGLAFEYYTHFTSPIRRYPDLIVHRILNDYLTNKKIEEDQYHSLERIASKSTEKEISAAQAERESIKYKQVEFMAEKIGQEFDTTVSGVTDWGIFVEEVNTKAEGLIRLSDLGDDYFEFNKKTYSVIGKRTKKTYTLGDKLKVKLVGADVDNSQLDFELISHR